MNDLILKEIYSLQAEYRAILNTFLIEMNSEDRVAISEEIQLFWFRKRRIVQAFLEYYIPKHETYIMFSATSLSFRKKEHYPILTLGQLQIWDDPLCSYLSTYFALPSLRDTVSINKLFRRLIKTNMEIIRQKSSNILVLPIRYVFELDNLEDVLSVGKRLFNQTFKDELQIQDHASYEANFHSVSEIENGLKPEISKAIIGPWNDEKSEVFIEVASILSTRNHRYEKGQVEVNLFYKFAIGSFSQAISLLALCKEYRVIPVVFDPITIHFLMLTHMFTNPNEYNDEMVIKARLAFNLIKLFPFSSFEKVGRVDFLKSLMNTDFYDSLSRNIELAKSSEYTSTDTIRHLIQNSLNMLLIEVQSN